MEREVSVRDIFCALQKDHNVDGLLTPGELASAIGSVLRVLSQTEISVEQAEKLRLSAMQEAGAGPEGISCGQFERAVQAPADLDREATRVPRVLLVSVLPILYGVSTRIGFVTLPMHAVASGLSLSEVGCVLGLFQLMRALANWVIVQRGSIATIPLVSLAVLGFAFCVWFPDHQLACWVYALTGLGEIIVSLQHEMMLLPCMAENPASLKRQFASVCLGACIAFVFGSALFAFVGFDASCLLGAICSLLQLVLGGYLYSDSRRQTSFSPWIHFPPDAFALRPFALGVGSLLAMSRIAAPSSQKLPDSQAEMLNKVDALLDPSLGRVALDKTVMECCVSTIMAPHAAHAQWQPHDDDVGLELEIGFLERLRRISCAAWCDSDSYPRIEGAQQVPWIVQPFLISQIFIALCIGTFLGTGGLYYAQVFGVNAFVFGVSMGFGELLGMLTSLMLPKTKASHSSQVMPLRPIILVLSVMVAITSVVLLFSAVPSFVGAVVLQLGFQVLNDVWTYLVNDVVHRLSPISQYRRLQGQGQMYRRVGNALAGIAGPILLGVWAPLPFMVAAAALAAWTVVMSGVVALHCNQLRRSSSHSSHSFASTLSQLVHTLKKDGKCVGRRMSRHGSKDSLDRTRSTDSMCSIVSSGEQDIESASSSLAFLLREVYGSGLIGLPARLFG